jgi:4-diphosphocytidyl-2-C-methyl-D-erythritol kinase
VEGAGEKMARPPEIPDMHFVLVNPMIPTPTARVFRNFRAHFSAPLHFSGRRRSVAAWIADLKMYRNDLTDAAITVTPEISDVLAALGDTAGCLLHRLSGSGATCFGIYNTAEEAGTAAHVLRTQRPEWWVVKADMLK